MKEGIENLISNREFGGIFASLAVAWVVFGPMIGLPKVKIWVAVLVAVLLTIGFGELFPKKKKFHHHGNNNSFSSSESTTDDNYVYCRTSFGEMTRYINSSDLKGAELKNSFGQLVVYFDNAIINDSSITINADNSFGETVIYIPKSWRLESKVRTSMGQCVIPESIADAAAPLVTITGHCKFGDLVVRYV